jgi:hypothetical protein
MENQIHFLVALPPKGAVDWVRTLKKTDASTMTGWKGCSHLYFLAWIWYYPIPSSFLFLCIKPFNNGKPQKHGSTSTLLEDTSVHIEGVKEIEAGEQLFSYDDCVDCEKRRHGYHK